MTKPAIASNKTRADQREKKIRKIVAELIAADRETFANNLEAARAVFRICPQAVTARKFPREFLGDLRRDLKQKNYDPDKEQLSPAGHDYADPKTLQAHRDYAIAALRGGAKKDASSQKTTP